MTPEQDNLLQKSITSLEAEVAEVGCVRRETIFSLNQEFKFRAVTHQIASD